MTPRVMYYTIRSPGDMRRVEHVAAEVSARAFESRAHRSAEPGKPLAQLPQLVRCEPYDARLTLRVCTTRHKSAQQNHKSGRKAIATIEAKLSACRLCADGAARCGRPAPKLRKVAELRECGTDGCDVVVQPPRRLCDVCNALALTRDGHGQHKKATGKEPQQWKERQAP